MSKVVTARLDEETLALVDRVAKAQGRSRAWFAAQAIRKVAEKEADFLAFIQQGVDAADRGELISQEEMERWWAERKANRRVAIAAE
jgi:predicted transcriptional regulator